MHMFTPHTHTYIYIYTQWCAWVQMASESSELGYISISTVVWLILTKWMKLIKEALIIEMTTQARNICKLEYTGTQ